MYSVQLKALIPILCLAECFGQVYFEILVVSDTQTVTNEVRNASCSVEANKTHELAAYFEDISKESGGDTPKSFSHERPNTDLRKTAKNAPEMANKKSDTSLSSFFASEATKSPVYTVSKQVKRSSLCFQDPFEEYDIFDFQRDDFRAMIPPPWKYSRGQDSNFKVRLVKNK